jgi:RNA polymerase sigma-54 factor
MLRISQNMSLQQKMAPQLIQSLQLLQMATLDLELYLKQELELNPLLEEGLELEEEIEEIAEKPEEGLKEEAELPKEAEEVDRDALLEDQFDQSEYNSERTEYDPNWEVDREPQENRITAIPPLKEQLQEQLVLTDLDGEARQIGEFILGSLDERGYLACSTLDIAEVMGVDIEEVERVLRVVQSFDPPGVAARDLRECLIIQLRQEQGSVAETALQIVRQYMEDMTKRRFSRITRGLSISNDELKVAMQFIEGLQPYPGSVSSSDYNNLLTLDMDVTTVIPDIIVEESGGEWVVALSDGQLPPLRVNKEYEELLRAGKGNGKKEVHSYVSEKLNDARWLINAIHQRRATMLKVSRYIVQAQMNFFEDGPAHLKPMVLQDVADAVEMHVSTISRVSNGKYMQTPHGVFELKYFFDSRVSTDDGEDVSARSVKQRIAQLVEEEDKAKPMSDQEIGNILGKDGLQIARRTVAKYRDQLKIPSQRYRKEL